MALPFLKFLLPSLVCFLFGLPDISVFGCLSILKHLSHCLLMLAGEFLPLTLPLRLCLSQLVLRSFQLVSQLSSHFLDGFLHRIFLCNFVLLSHLVYFFLQQFLAGIGLLLERFRVLFLESVNVCG